MRMIRHDAEADPASLAAMLPDEPRWVDCRGTLLSGRCRVFAEDDPRHGFVVRSLDFPYACTAFDPTPRLVAWARAVDRAASKRFKLLVQESDAPRWAGRLAGWSQELVLIHRYGGTGEPSPANHTEIHWVAESAALPLEATPAELRAELSLVLHHQLPLAAGFVDGRPVSFCYAALQTESLWDVAVATLAPYRRRGLAAACFEEVRRRLALRGLEPVWGAMASNSASLALATRLGFVRDAVLVGFRPPA